MIEILEYTGIWYLPNNLNNQLAGTLVFEPDKEIYLNLTGDFNQFSIDLAKEEIILGFTTTGKKISLVKCYCTNRSGSFPGILTTRYKAHYVFEGAHFLTINEIKFYKLSSQITKLEEWVNVFGRKLKFTEGMKEFNYDFKTPECISFNINDNLKGGFYFYYKQAFESLAFSKIEQVTSLELSVDGEEMYNVFLGYLSHFNSFVTLGVFEATYIKEIEFFSKTILNELNNGLKYEMPVKLYYVQKHKNHAILKRHFHEFLFNYKQIESDFETIIKKWYLLKDSISPVLNDLLFTFSNKEVFTENRFLDVVRALEIYHRRIKENNEKLLKEFKFTLDPILDLLDENQRNWISEKLEYKYEPSLRKRLKELFKEFSIQPLTNIVISKSDLKELINKTTISRNYYTHYNVDLKKDAYHGMDLYVLSEKLIILLIIIILRETGFENNEIETLFKEKEYDYFNHIMKK
ncbi:MAG: hypothetical protein HXX14_09260 [Bacteroidetes bacterium]|nr:hypothetical protein [Bacteroidota bacterium]